MSLTNIYTNIPANLSEELFETILSKPGLRIERIVSHGQASPPGFWYDQQQGEFVLLLKGKARLQFESETIDLVPGSFVDISPHRRHRVEWTDPEQETIWLAIHYAS